MQEKLKIFSASGEVVLEADLADFGLNFNVVYHLGILGRANFYDRVFAERHSEFIVETCSRLEA